MFIHLENRALLKVSGSDAETFLQGQFSNDIKKLNTSSVQLNAYCQHQGKILALIWVMRHETSFFLSFSLDLLEVIKSRLQMFVIMSDVNIDDITSSYHQIGIIDEKHQETYVINDKLSLIIDDKNNSNKFKMDSLDIWNMACIDSCLPEIYLKTAEKLVPQMLNLDIDEIGVNFSKGCYPGQEVVARLHYLGSAKRRLFAFKSEANLNVGDALYCASSKTAKVRGNRYKGSGVILNKVKFNSLFHCLATLDVDLIDNEITLNNAHGPTIKIIKK